MLAKHLCFLLLHTYRGTFKLIFANGSVNAMVKGNQATLSAYPQKNVRSFEEMFRVLYLDVPYHIRNYKLLFQLLLFTQMILSKR